MPVYCSVATPRSIIESPEGYSFPNHRFQDDRKITLQPDRKTLRSELPDYRARVDEDENTFQSALAEADDIGGRDSHAFHRALLCADDVTERIRRVSLLARYRNMEPLDLPLSNLQTLAEKQELEKLSLTYSKLAQTKNFYIDRQQHTHLKQADLQLGYANIALKFAKQYKEQNNREQARTALSEAYATLALISHARNEPSTRAIYAGKALRISPHQRNFLLDFLQRAVDTQSLLFYKQACAEAITVLTSGNRITDASFQTISAALKLESPVTIALMRTLLNAESKDSKFFATIRIIGAKLSDPSISREQKLTWAFEAANASIGDRERFAQAFEAILNLKSIDTSLKQANHSTKSLMKLLRDEKSSKVALHRAQQRLLDYCDNSSKESLKAQFTLAHTTDLLRLAKEAIAEEHATG